ncbi:MAG TPA: hypothetical protein VHC49_13045 [Mycobacteriales bacterium]|nr:hypothetical protein [Mycobacteriales bacterium]
MLAASSTAQAGPLGLAVIVVIGLALFFLIRSMNTHLRRVPRSFTAEEARKGGADAPEPKSSGSAGSDTAD